MLYAKLNNGILEYAPMNYTMPTGGLIVNFNKNIALMKSYGFKEVIDNKPSYDNTTQYLSVSGYVENENNVIINYVVNEIETSKEPTLEEKVEELETKNEELKQMDNELVATSWDMDFRMCEIEWALEDLGIGQEISTMSLENNIIKNTKGSVSNMALTRFEQAKIMIIGGVYNKETLTKQLTTYLNRGYLTQEEYDELIALMEAKDLVVEE